MRRPYHRNMKYDPHKHHRRSTRLRGYDYASAGAYFITICTRERESVFGEITNGGMVLNEYGKIAVNCWLEIPAHFPQVELDEYIFMPNHVHGIVMISGGVGATHASPSAPHGPKPKSIGSIAGSFKSAAAKRINQRRNGPGTPLWQRNFYDHIIRDNISLEAIRRYIHYNPLLWQFDADNVTKARAPGAYTDTSLRSAMPLLKNLCGFTPEEPEFIINYDTEYCRGANAPALDEP
ncbi:MAG: transposase [Dehalococcoidia bacterium]